MGRGYSNACPYDMDAPSTSALSASTAEERGALDQELRTRAAALVRGVTQAEREGLQKALVTVVRSTVRPPPRALIANLVRKLSRVSSRDQDDRVVAAVLRELFGKLYVDEARAVEQHVFFARWGELQMPTLHVGGREASALMLSDIGDEQLAALRSPWRAFTIKLEEPLTASGAQVEEVWVLRPMGSAGATKLGAETSTWGWVFYAVSGDALMRRAGPSALELYRTKPAFSPNPLHEDDVPRDLSEDERLLGLITRLVLNVCVAVDGLGGSSAAELRPRTRRRRGEKRRRMRSLDGNTGYDFHLPVSVDVRGHVADYLSGDVKRVYKLRWIVRGHWRNQPYGPDRSLRRLTWIEPYWKGPGA
jgi:hypothetical protein